jgi:hypothetical protein
MSRPPSGGAVHQRGAMEIDIRAIDAAAKEVFTGTEYG